MLLRSARKFLVAAAPAVHTRVRQVLLILGLEGLKESFGVGVLVLLW